MDRCRDSRDGHAARVCGSVRNDRCQEICLRPGETRESGGFRRIDLLSLLKSKEPAHDGHAARYFQNKNNRKQRHIGY